MQVPPAPRGPLGGRRAPEHRLFDTAQRVLQTRLTTARIPELGVDSEAHAVAHAQHPFFQGGDCGPIELRVQPLTILIAFHSANLPILWGRVMIEHL